MGLRSFIANLFHLILFGVLYYGVYRLYRFFQHPTLRVRIEDVQTRIANAEGVTERTTTVDATIINNTNQPTLEQPTENGEKFSFKAFCEKAYSKVTNLLGKNEPAVPPPMPVIIPEQIPAEVVPLETETRDDQEEVDDDDTESRLSSSTSSGSNLSGRRKSRRSLREVVNGTFGSIKRFFSPERESNKQKTESPNKELVDSSQLTDDDIDVISPENNDDTSSLISDGD